MKNTMKNTLIAAVILSTVSAGFTGCKKGENDPFISFMSRKGRLAVLLPQLQKLTVQQKQKLQVLLFSLLLIPKQLLLKKTEHGPAHLLKP